MEIGQKVYVCFQSWTHSIDANEKPCKYQFLIIATVDTVPALLKSGVRA